MIKREDLQNGKYVQTCDLDAHFGDRMPTEREALEWSILKWELLGEGNNWALAKLGADSCGLCRRYSRCDDCPLDYCADEGHPWEVAFNASGEGDRPAFMRARYNLLRRVCRALAKLEDDK